LNRRSKFPQPGSLRRTPSRIPKEALKKVNDDRTRSNQVKKRGLQVVNEHFEPDFNAA